MLPLEPYDRNGLAGGPNDITKRHYMTTYSFLSHGMRYSNGTEYLNYFSNITN